MHPYRFVQPEYPPWMQFYPRDKTASKEDILVAHPPSRCGLSGLCHILCVRSLALRVMYKTVGYAPIYPTCTALIQ